MFYNDPQGPDDKDTPDLIEGQRDSGTVVSNNAVRELPKTNAAPVFTERSVMREVAENTRAGGSVGDVPVTAADGDEDVLTYSLSGGADKDRFHDQPGRAVRSRWATIRIWTSREPRATYTVEVKAEDPFALSDTTTVTITVTNVDEAPVLELGPRQHRAQVRGGRVPQGGGREHGCGR